MAVDYGDFAGDARLGLQTLELNLLGNSSILLCLEYTRYGVGGMFFVGKGVITVANLNLFHLRTSNSICLPQPANCMTGIKRCLSRISSYSYHVALHGYCVSYVMSKYCPLWYKYDGP